jgi:hypothetical protein
MTVPCAPTDMACVKQMIPMKYVDLAICQAEEYRHLRKTSWPRSEFRLIINSNSLTNTLTRVKILDVIVPSIITSTLLFSSYY